MAAREGGFLRQRLAVLRTNVGVDAMPQVHARSCWQANCRRAEPSHLLVVMWVTAASSCCDGGDVQSWVQHCTGEGGFWRCSVSCHTDILGECVLSCEALDQMGLLHRISTFVIAASQRCIEASSRSLLIVGNAELQMAFIDAPAGGPQSYLPESLSCVPCERRGYPGGW